MTVNRPARTTRKYSGGPNVLANDAIAGAAKVNRQGADVPAANEARAAITNAGPARPCLASG